MSWLRSHRRTATLVGLTLLLPVYFYLNTLFGLLGLAFDYADQRQRIAPRVGRLQGLLDNESKLRAQSAVATERLRDVVFSADEDSSALAASLQADVRQLLSGAGMSVSNSQVMPVREGDTFDRVAVKLTATGTLAALDAALQNISGYRPRLLVESVDLFPARSVRQRDEGDSQSLTAVIQLMALRELP